MTSNGWLLVEEVVRACRERGIDLVLYPGGATPKGDLGEFDPQKKHLMVAAQDPDWLYVLAHEAGHLEQWAANHPTWYPERDDFRTLELWLRGRDYDGREFVHAIRRIQRCEHFAEKYALKLLRKFKHPDTARYCQGANFGLWRFEHLRQTRTWIDQTDERVAKMPRRLISVARASKLPAGWF
jgi:hypothetical protein